MRVKDIMDYCQRNGVVVHEEREMYANRRNYYKMIIPVFVGDELIPSGNREYLVKTPKQCYEYMKELLEDDLFRRKVAAWVRGWE